MQLEERLARIRILGRAIRKCYTEKIKTHMIECFLTSIEQLSSYSNEGIKEIIVNLDTDDIIAKEILS